MGTKSNRRARGRAFSEDEEAVKQVGVRVERSAVARNPEAAAPLDDSGFRTFVAAGADATGEFRCADCGYGAVVQHALPPCPMCASTVWERRGPVGSRFPA